MPNGPFDFNNATVLNLWCGSSGVSVLSGATVTVRDANAGLVYTSAAPDGPLLFGFTGVKFGSQTGGLGTNAFVSNAIFTSAVTFKVTNGQIQTTVGSALLPAYTFSSESSLGLYSSGVQTIAQSYGTLNLATNAVRLSMRTLGASSVTASAANTNVATNEVVFTIGGASGASLCISSGGTTYIFSSALSARNT